MAPLPSSTATLSSRSTNFLTSALTSTTNLFTRALLSARQMSTNQEDKEELAFWEKHKPFVIGVAVFIPLQILFGIWYMRRRKARKAILATALAEVEQNRQRMKIMNLEHAMNASSASSSAGNSSYGSSVAGSSASGSGYRGETYRMQDLSMGPPPPVYDGRRGPGSGAVDVGSLERMGGGKI